MKIGIIGFGNMGSAIATGLVKRGVSQDDLLISDKLESAVKRAHVLGINNAGMDRLVEKSDVVILCIDKAVYDNLELTSNQLMGKTVISCISDINMNELSRRFKTQIVRAMPTLAVENNVGITGLCFDEYAQNKEEIIALFEKLGYVYTGNEDDMAKIAALGACGLSYAAYILNSFINSAQNIGFSEADAHNLVYRTFNSAMDMGDYELLMGRVSARGGVASVGLETLEDNNVSRLIDNIIKASYTTLNKE